MAGCAPFFFCSTVVDTVISRDGETLQLGEMTLTFYLAPGHTEDGLYTVVEPYGIFLSGDYLSDVEFPFITSSYKEYVKTVEKASFIMENHDIRFQVPGHGNVTANTQELAQRIAFSEDYLKRLEEYDSTLENDLKANYQFFEGMKDSHYENLKLLKDK